MKRLLRDKANFNVLEGFLTSLLGRPIRIISILESEGNKDYEENKSNRVDLLAQEENGSRIIIEVQNETEDSYFHRMLFGSSKIINDFLKSGEGYENVSKVYSVNIVYFPLGEGNDYVYHGKTEFRGIHSHELLKLSPKLRKKFHVNEISEIYPEYYILRVNDFDKVAKTHLDQWMYFLRNSKLPENADAPGLNEAAEKLRVATLSESERTAYYRYIDNMISLEEAVNSSYTDGVYEGRIEGISEGRQQRDSEIVKRMLSQGLDPETISKFTGIPKDEIENC